MGVPVAIASPLLRGCRLVSSPSQQLRFKKTVRLTPAVVLHMVYEAVVIGLTMP